MKIQKVLELTSEEILKTNLHFAIGYTDPLEPLYSFYRDEFKEWQEYQDTKHFKRDYILSLIHFQDDEWLFAGFYKVVYLANSKTLLKTELMDKASYLIGRLVVKFSCSHKKKYITNLESNIQRLELSEILREKRSNEPFRGFKNVKLNFNVLQAIVDKKDTVWKTAMENAKGVYLITDLKTGKLFINTAYGSLSFWDCMVEYAETGHGNDKYLKKLLQFHGDTYKSNLQFSILESREIYGDNNEIIIREAFWKEVLVTREFGYNMY